MPLTCAHSADVFSLRKPPRSTLGTERIEREKAR